MIVSPRLESKVDNFNALSKKHGLEARLMFKDDKLMMGSKHQLEAGVCQAVLYEGDNLDIHMAIVNSLTMMLCFERGE